MKLQDKIILITGASSGIGRATALRFAQDKPHLILSSRSQEKLEKVKIEVEALGANAETMTADVTNTNEVKDLFLKINKKYNKLDVVFNNAGLGYIAEIEDLTTEQIEKMVDVNVKGMIMVTKYASEIMTRNQEGHIIMTSSLAGYITIPQWSVYTATKWAIRAFGDTVRQEMKQYNTKVTTIHPGAVKTEFFDQSKADIDIAKLGSAITPEEVAEQVYKAVFTDKKHVLVPKSASLYAKLYKYFPGLVGWLLSRMANEVEYHEDLNEDEPEFDSNHTN